MNARKALLAGLAGAIVWAQPSISPRAGSLTGLVLDPNWYARYSTNPIGVGFYEYGVNASGSSTSAAALFGAGATDVHGRFAMNGLSPGVYQAASWDVWWRSAFAWNIAVPASGSTSPVELRLSATMWGYPAFWDERGYYEFGQTFVATGPISMIYLRCPYSTSYTLTVHTNGPGGPQIGVTRTFQGGDQRPIYGYGDMPTVAGGKYYLRVRSSTAPGVIMQMEPRPDFIDPMPGGCLYLGDSQGVTAFPDRDLGVIIMSDDDGLLTNLSARPGGGNWNMSRLGQTFIARGASLVSAAFWLADPAAPGYEVQVYQEGPGGAPVGPVRRGKPARVTADPEMLVIWPPGECPLTPGETYYIEVRRAGGGVFNAAYVHPGNPYPFGQAYRDGVALASADVAGTTMEEASPGSATRAAIRFISDPAVGEADRGSRTLTVRWATDQPSDSQVEWAPLHPPYTRRLHQTQLATQHAVTLDGLRAHTLHHFRVRSEAPGFKPAISRDFVICTQPATSNLLANPGFEIGSGGSPRKPVYGWTAMGSTENSLDMAAADGTWFWGLKPRTGAWLFQGAANNSAADGCLFQRAPAVPGRHYTFSAWVCTSMRENDDWKYDVWQDRNRLSWVRLGIDPAGGSNPAAATVEWTPRFYSHRRFANAAHGATAQGDFLTVFVEMKGAGGQWHLFGVDDCVLTETAPSPPEFSAFEISTEALPRMTITADPGRTIVVESTSDFHSWETLANLANPTGIVEFSDPDPAREPGRFYRAHVP